MSRNTTLRKGDPNMLQRKCQVKNCKQSCFIFCPFSNKYLCEKHKDLQPSHFVYPEYETDCLDSDPEIDLEEVMIANKKRTKKMRRSFLDMEYDDEDDSDYVDDGRNANDVTEDDEDSNDDDDIVDLITEEGKRQKLENFISRFQPAPVSELARSRKV